MRPMKHRNPWLPTVFNDLFDVNLMPRLNAQAPAINVLESESCYMVEFASPGMKKEDFSVNINGEGNLIVKMERKDTQNEENKNAHYLRREFSYAKYEQALILPDDVEKGKISAKMENGILYIELPKTEPAAQKVERQIEIC